MRVTRTRHLFTRALLWAVVLFAASSPAVMYVFAAGTRLPQINGTNPNDLFLEIARDGYGNTLDAETTSAKLIFGAKQAGQIGIYDGNFCYTSNTDSNDTAPGAPTPPFSTGSCAAPANVDNISYKFSMLQDGPDVTGRALNIGAGNTCTAKDTPKVGCLAPLVKKASDFAVNGWSFVDLSYMFKFANDTDQKFFVQLDVSWDVRNGAAGSGICSGGKCGGVNTFKLWIPPTTDKTWGTHGTDGSYVTYATDNNSAYPLAIQQRPLDPRRHSDYSFQFAPDCTTPPGADVVEKLRWYNADYGNPPQTNDPDGKPFGGKLGFILHDDTDNKDVSFWDPYLQKNVTSLSGTPLGGDGNPPSGFGPPPQSNPQTFPNVNFKGGHKYTWTWYNVDSYNGVQIYQPFSGYNYNRNCYYLQSAIGGDQTIDVSSTTSVTGTAFVRNQSDYKDTDDAHLEVAQVDPSIDPTGTIKTPPYWQPWTVQAISGYLSNETVTASEVAPAVANVAGGFGGSDCAGHQAFFPDTETPACKQSHWRWQFKTGPTTSLPANSGWISKSYNFTVSNTIPDGTRLCFAAYIGDRANTTGSSNWDASNNRQCFTFKNPRFPNLQIHGGDAHAGGFTTASCTAPSSGGSINGASQATGTYGDYVVSAGGSINNFGSNGADAVNKSLLFGYSPSSGTAGFYARLCRYDLGGAVASYGADHGLVTGTIGNEANDIANNPNQVIKYSGTVHLGNLTINNPVTIWVNGDLYLDGNFILPGGSYGVGGPSFGVVVTGGNIYVSKNMTQMFGYYYQSNPGNAASGIYTCHPFTNQINDCSSTLNLYGFMSADNFHFERLGTAAFNYGEIVNPSNYGYDFSALLINPPPAFSTDASLDQRGTRFDGERPPLY